MTEPRSEAVDSLLQAARAAEYRKDSSLAIALVRAACVQNPDVPRCHIELALLLWRTGQHQEAERTLASAVQRFPSSPEPAVEHAKLPMWNDDSDEALRRWRRVREQFPDESTVWSGSGAALLNMGRAEDAEALLGEATIKFPDSCEVAAWSATVARRRGHWAEAERRFAAAAAAFPMHTGIRLARQKLNYLSRLSRASHAYVVESPWSRDGSISSEDERYSVPSGRAAVLTQCQSLGRHCEFGRIQRRFGAEPLDLLRFASVSTTPLLKMLEKGCCGIGDPKNMFVLVRNREYYVVDTKLRISWHTGEYDYATDEQDLLAREHRRLSYLASKFVQDLNSAARIFVHVSNAPLDVGYCESLARALQQHSPQAILLCVGFGASLEQPRVLWGGKGLLLAERTAMLLTWRWPDDETAPPYQQWLDICAGAMELIEDRRATNSARADDSVHM